MAGAIYYAAATSVTPATLSTPREIGDARGFCFRVT